jgi:phage terminase large subunit-like protein
LVSTRWHEDDLAGRLLRQSGEGSRDVLRLPAIAETDETFRRAGEALWPTQYSLKALEHIRREIGGANFASLYQQRPAAAEGAVFNRGWWRYYRDLPVCQRVVQSWDTAFKAGVQNDYSVCSTWGVLGNGYYLLSLWRGRVDFPELKRLAGSLGREWKANAILVEDAASGQSLIQELRRESALPIIPVKVDRDKVARAGDHPSH